MLIYANLWLLHFWTKTRFCVEIALCQNCLCRSDWHPWHVMKLLDEANGFIEGDIFVKYYMINRLTFKVGLYNMFQWHFRGSRPMTRQYHNNWLRIDLELKENHSPRCESDYNISLRPVGSEKVAISPLFQKSTHQTRHIQCWFNVEPPYSKLAHHQLQL